MTEQSVDQQFAEQARRWSVPDWIADDARRFAESGASVVTPKTAATVVLLRPADHGGIEAYVQQRAATMAFAPGMYAFPGGSVDVHDVAAAVSWVGNPPQWWADRLGLPEPDATAVVCAAVREVFEESGVLLAGPDESTVVEDVSTPDWEDERAALAAHEVSFTEVLRSRGLAVRSDLLAPWARYLTPEFEPRRFDTFFFLARLPLTQRPRQAGGESVRTSWVVPAHAASLPMLPPTAHTLRRLASHDDVDSALAAAAQCDLREAVIPQLLNDGDDSWLIL